MSTQLRVLIPVVHLYIECEAKELAGIRKHDVLELKNTRTG